MTFRLPSRRKNTVSGAATSPFLPGASPHLRACGRPRGFHAAGGHQLPDSTGARPGAGPARLFSPSSFAGTRSRRPVAGPDSGGASFERGPIRCSGHIGMVLTQKRALLSYEWHMNGIRERYTGLISGPVFYGEGRELRIRRHAERRTGLEELRRETNMKIQPNREAMSYYGMFRAELENMLASQEEEPCRRAGARDCGRADREGSSRRGLLRAGRPLHGPVESRHYRY